MVLNKLFGNLDSWSFRYLRYANRMNTSTHLLISAAALGPHTKWRHMGPILLGAVLPDALMFVFYGWQKLIGTPEQEIWNTEYFKPFWQDVFDVANSIPIALVLLLIGLKQKTQWLIWLSASMLLHIALDLPLHHDDGHRHFWPLSNWRFSSPVSYWDPNHYGSYVLIIEAFLMTLCLFVCVRSTLQRKWKVALAVVYGLQFAVLFYFMFLFSFAGNVS